MGAVRRKEHQAIDQNPDGSFTRTKRWMEDNPIIATSFAVLAAQEALADLRKNPAK